MYKEYRDMSRTDAVESMYQDMAARHRSRFRQIHVRSPSAARDALHSLPSPDHDANDILQILKVVEVEKTDDIRRPYIKQLLTKNLKFPLPHRNPPKKGGKVFSAQRPSTFY
jgi:large subunit ribosomal protein L18Ae